MPVYARQAKFLWQALIGGAQEDTLRCKTLHPSDLARLAGADVLLVFLESYGAVAYDRPAFSAAFAASRERPADAARRTQRGVVSAYPESPTFGGSSWLAHSSLLTGVEVREPQSYHLLLTRECDTLPDRFARQGYRTLDLMPGLRYAWPEWEVPVHVITRHTDILESLQSAGLQPGLEPSRPTLGPMHELTAMLLKVFDSGQTSPRSASNRAALLCQQSGVDIP